jgi:ERCC4-type nuclease
MRDMDETVRFVDKLIKLIKQKKLLMLRRPIILEDDIDPRIAFLSALPNINKARATEILGKYQSVEDAFAHIEEWESFNGITIDRLAQIRKIWKHIGEWSYVQ